MQDMFISGDMRRLPTYGGRYHPGKRYCDPIYLQFVPSLESKLPMGETTGIAVPKGEPDYVLEALDKALTRR